MSKIVKMQKKEDMNMKKTAIVTDSNSGITQNKAKELGIFVVPMPFFINGEMYMEDITLSQDEFYQKLASGADISTSQPSPGDLTDLWEHLLKEYEEIVHIPMSSGLSSSCENAMSLSMAFDGKVQVVNNQRISVTQYQSVMDAMIMAEDGLNALEIKTKMEEMALDASIYITVETLEYLRKGGRITPAAATVGTILNIKPVLQIQGAKLDAYAKVRGKVKAKKTILDAVKEDMASRFKEYAQQGNMEFGAAYSGNLEEALIWKQEIEEAFPEIPVRMDPLSLSVSCHIGEGAIAIGCYRKYQSVK